MFYTINPALLPFHQSSFSFRPLNREFRGPYRSRSELPRPQRVASRPLCLNERGRGIRRASACVVAFCLPRGQGGPAEPPSPPRQHRNTKGSKEVASSLTFARTHTIPLHLTQFTLYLLEVTRKKREVGGRCVCVCVGGGGGRGGD